MRKYNKYKKNTWDLRGLSDQDRPTSTKTAREISTMRTKKITRRESNISLPLPYLRITEISLPSIVHILYITYKKYI